MTRTAWAVLACATVACGGTKPPAKEGDQTTVTARWAPPPPTDAGVPRSEALGDGGALAPRVPAVDPACTGAAIDLIDALSKAACEVPSREADTPARDVTRAPDLQGVLEVKVIPSARKVAPGGHVELMLTFRNTAKTPLALDFVVNPLPRFEVEAYDAKGKRVDMPATEHPPFPGDMKMPPPPEQKTARVVLAPNGTGRAALGWDAIKMRWAPEKAKGMAIGSGYPRMPAGPLPKGKYTLHVVTPLTEVFEGAAHELSVAKAEIEVAR